MGAEPGTAEITALPACCHSPFVQQVLLNNNLILGTQERKKEGERAQQTEVEKEEQEMGICHERNPIERGAYFSRSRTQAMLKFKNEKKAFSSTSSPETPSLLFL